MLKIQVSGDTMIFRKDFDGRATYSTTISKKLADGTWENAYIGIQFKKDVVLQDKTKIEVKNGWLTHYLNKEKKPVYYLFILDFESETQEPQIPDGFTKIDDSVLPF